MSKIRVKKPFDFLLDEKQKQKEHEEHEEKPIVDSQQQISEDFHGGSESTESLPNTPSPSINQQQEVDNQQNSKSINSKANEEKTSQQDSEASDSSKMQENSENNNASNNNKETSQQERRSEEKEAKSSEEENKVEESSKANNTTSEERDNINESEDSDVSEEYEEEGEEAEEEEKEEEVEGKSDDIEGDSDAEADTDDEESEEESGEGEEESEEEEGEAEEEEDSDEQQNSYQYNTQQVVSLTNTEAIARYYQTEFYRFIETIAEEKLRIYDFHDFDEYNVKKLMFRQFEKKSLNHYRMSRVRDSVVLILDNSGSMQWWAKNLRILADLALQRNDVEVYIAPNGYVEEKLAAKGAIEVEHGAAMKQLNGRKIIYVGDYDGANTAVRLSWYNDVVWVCPESRYRRFKSHDWVSYSEEDYKGVFIRAYNLEEMFEAFKRVNRLYRLWIDFHEGDRFQDDWG